MSDGGDFAEKLAEQQRLLEEVRKTGKPIDTGPVEATGSSADKSVTVTVRNREVVAIDVDKSVPERPTSDIATLLATAVNAALAAYRAQAPSAEDPLPDLTAIRDQLREASDNGSRMMQMIGSSLQDAIDTLGPRTGMRGNPSSNSLDMLMTEAMDTLKATQQSLADYEEPIVIGYGWDEDREIQATIGQNGTLTAVEFFGSVQGMSGPALGQAACEAVSEAFEDWERQRREEAEESEVDTEALKQLSSKAESLREQSIERFRGYTSNLKSIMNSVEPPPSETR